MMPNRGHVLWVVVVVISVSNFQNSEAATVLCHPGVQYACRDGFQCLPSTWHCDGEVECKDFSDEENCGETVCSASDEFQCRTSQLCIPTSWVCDGEQDCADNSDEEADCQGRPAETQCPANRWACPIVAGTCIHGSQICNGVYDCPLYSDEGVFCIVSGGIFSGCRSRPCTNCSETVMGPFCYCDDGLQINEDTYRCEDINECKESPCEQNCANTHGTYRCSCVEGYNLHQEHCVVPDESVSLIYTNLTSIQSVDIKRETMSPVTLIPADGAVVMDIDVRRGLICWIVYGLRDDELRCSSMDNITYSETITLNIDLKNINNFAIDWVTGNLYFVDNLDQIIVCDTSGALCITIIDTGISKPIGFALDPLKGVMFFGGQGSRVRKDPHIFKSNMDGSNLTRIVSTKIISPRSLAVDPYLERIYWYDSSLEQIWTADYNGKQKKVLARGVYKVDQIAVFENFLYATRWGEESSLLRMDRFTSDEAPFMQIVRRLSRPGALRINNALAQPMGDTRRCASGSNMCSDLCILSGPGQDDSVCRCQLGLTLEGNTCVWKTPIEPFLLYGQGIPGSVHGIPLTKEDNLNKECMKPVTGLNSPRAVDFYAAEEYVYFADSAQYLIGRKKLNETDAEVIYTSMIAKCEGISVDWIGKNLYWTDDGLKVIVVGSLYKSQGEGMRKILIKDNLTHPRDIEVDPIHGYMYWTDWAESKYSVSLGKIMKATMDGANVEVLIDEDLLWPNGLSLDTENQYLYWCDAYYDKIEKINLETGVRKVILSEESPGLFLKHPFGIATHNNAIFWSEYRLRYIHKYEDNTTSILKQGGLMFEIKVYDPSKQYGTNACSESNGGCQEFCLAVPEGRVCACKDGNKIYNETQCVRDENYTKFTRCKGNDRFSCKNGRCISRQWRCDEENDCGDDSDEEECDSGYQDCPKDKFRCDNTHCINEDWKCDGDDDCGDNSDENDCGDQPCAGYRCPEGRCLPQAWVCDGDVDCGDGSDESDCSPTERPECDEGLFQCFSGSCISNLWLCDGEDDCGDMSDESECINCTQPDYFRCEVIKSDCIRSSLVCDGKDDCIDGTDDSRNLGCSTVCDDNFFSCLDGNCLPNTVKCNGEFDCANGLDEFNCPDCPLNTFGCYNDSTCIPTEKVCDGKNNCADNSDEADCQLAPCPKGTYKCKDEPRCLPYENLCNQEVDCVGGDDEGNYCNVTCDPKEDNTDCAICYRSPDGPFCHCPDGQVMTGHLNTTCIPDMNMCRMDGRCSQICTNGYDRDQNVGLFFCSCYPGYALEKSDARSCKYTGSEDPYIIFSNRNQLRRYNLRTKEYNILVFNLRNSVALDFDYNNSHIYWTDVADDKIYRGTVDKESPNAGLRDITTVIQSGLGSSEGLAVDWIGQNLYWVESILDQIEVADLNGTYRKTLLADDIENPRAIALDPRDGLLFWSDWEEAKPRIERATMAGKDRKVIFNVSDISGGWPNGLTLDYWERRVYWIDAKSDTIHSSDYNGNHMKWVHRRSQSILHPFSITIFEDRVYWTDWRNIGVYSANKWTGEDETEVQQVAMHPFGIHVYHPTKQPTAVNPCESNPCSHLCLINGSDSYECACPHLTKLDEDSVTCLNSSVFLVFARNTEIRGVELEQSMFNVIPALTSPKIAKVTSVDHDVVNEHIYWTDLQRRTVNRVNIRTFIVETVMEGLADIHQVAVDWVSRNVYWMLRKEENSVLYASNLNGSFQMELGVNLSRYSHSLILDPVNGYMYWMDGHHEDHQPSLNRAEMDGTNQEVLINTGLANPKGLALDRENSVLYWTEAGSESTPPGIFRSSINNPEATMLVQLEETDSPHTITVYKGMIYWADKEDEDKVGSIKAIPYDSTNSSYIKTLRSTVSNIKGLFVYDPDSKKDDTNGCSNDNGGCNQLCFPKPAGTVRVCACTAGYYISSSGESNKTNCVGVDKFILYSTPSTIQGISADASNLKSHLPPVTGQASVQSIDFYAKEEMIYWVDTAAQTIYQIERGHTERKAVITSGLGYVEAISVDPVAGNIYWADQRTKTIGVAKIGQWEQYLVVRESTDVVKSIAVHPTKGFLFWTNSSPSNPAVRRAYLDGSGNITILNDTITEPVYLAVDVEEDKIYVSGGNKILRMDLNGTNQELIIEGNSTMNISKIAVDSDNIYWLDRTHLSRSIVRVSKANPVLNESQPLRWNLSESTSQRQETDLTVYRTTSMEGTNACSVNNGGCQQLCFFVGDHRRCACAYDKLDKDNVSCKEYDAYIIYSQRKSIQRIPLGENHKDSIRPLTNADNVIGIAPVYSRTGIFFTDIHNGSILYSSLITENATTVTIREGIGSVEGIAYNHITNEIFWTSYTNSSISRMRVFPHSRASEEVVVSMSGSDHPRGIALDVCNSSIYWTNWNDLHPCIMTSSMTGKDVRAIIETDIRTPNGIAIDGYARKLYWCDARLDKIERADLDGTNRVVIIDSDPVHPFGLAIHEDRLYWTDWVRLMVIRVDKYTGGNLTVLRSELNQQPMGIAIFVEPHNCSAWPCATYNGGCEEFCDTDEYGTITCNCSDGKTLASDRQRCLPPVTQKCDTNQFLCSNGTQCIPFNQTCDGTPQCDDSSDEGQNYCYARLCGRDLFKCQNNRCISLKLRCNREDDCGDNSDEENCDCRPDEFQCSYGKCISRERKCNHILDCDEAEDEINCGDFSCSLWMPTPEVTWTNCRTTSVCISSLQRCDGVNDCGDNSDEELCDIGCPEGDTFYRCQNSNYCIPNTWKCDGEVDCPDGDDEGSQCNNTCSDYETQCREDGSQCILLHWLCDGDEDCPTGSDEQDCEGSENCGPDQFTCVTTQRCIPETWHCDQDDDCGDNSDEEDCYSVPCDGESEYACLNGQCIRQAWVCDHDHDCADSSDEPPDCDYANCSASEFKCTDGRCIWKDWKCDGQFDCLDKSDEVDCVCSSDEFRCANGDCIPEEERCNFLNDCGDNSDEQDCEYSRCREELPCPQRCIDLPTGKRSYCYCTEGFKLVDQTSCLLEHEEKPFLVYSSRHNISRIDFSGNNKAGIVGNLRNAIAVDFDWQEQHVYWSNIDISKLETKTTIHRANFDGTNSQVIIESGIQSGDGLAVDWVGRHLYWTDKGLNRTEVSDLNGRNRKVLISEGLEEPRALALHPRNGTFYWTDWGSKPYIGKAGMDGGNPRHLVNTKLIWPNGLTIDYTTDRIFWGDAGTDRIEFVESDGSNRHVVFSEGLTTPHIFSITVFSDTIFWGDWLNHTIFSAHKYYSHRENKEVTSIITTNERPMDLHVVHPLRQIPVLPSPCENNGGCSNLCLLREGGGRTCACPTGNMILTSDNATCKEVCPPYHFPCGITKCIPAWWVCDGQVDCDDGQDESNQTCARMPYSCPHTGMFQCANSTESNPECIYNVLVCDREDDCSDGSDEKFCPHHVSGCLPGLWHCGNDGPCISATRHCDGTPDCPKGEDEANCDEACDLSSLDPSVLCDGINDCLDGTDEKNCEDVCDDVENFYCGDEDGVCISSDWECDGEVDCSNGADEHSGCEEQTCSTYRFPCDNSNCIPQQWVCDQEDDCGDNSDERDCPTDPPQCENLFLCESEGICIPQEWKCDGEPNCIDHQDEDNCESEPPCDGFKCENSNQCINSTWKCDGQRDCFDGSDETNCATQRNCTQDEFKCSNDGQCIPKMFRCDGDFDCVDKTDESSCLLFPCPYKFKCDSGVCISQVMRCDGVDQCGDARRPRSTVSSDERYCPRPRSTVECSSDTFKCSGKEHMTQQGDCFPNHYVCDSIEDCEFGEDEDYCFRGITCDDREGFCDQGCRDTRYGLRCLCSEGYTLSASGRGCKDIDECQQFGACTHECHNFDGGHHCSCSSGYYPVTSSDNLPSRLECQPYGPPPFMLVMDESQVKRLYPYRSLFRLFRPSTYGRRPYTIERTFPGKRVDSADVSIKDRDIYILMADTKTVMRVKTVGSGTRVRRETSGNSPSQTAQSAEEYKIDAMAKPKHVSLDWTSKKLYWTDAGLNDVGVLDLDSGVTLTLFSGNVRDPFAIRVHPRQGKLYFTTLQTASIYSASMDGKNLTRLPINDLIWPTGLAIDPIQQRLYWADPKRMYIGSSNLAGQDEVAVKYFPRGEASAFSIDLFASTLYGTTYLQNGVFFMNKFNRSESSRTNFTLVMTNLSRPSDLIVFQEQKQDSSILNPCDGVTCPDNSLCLISSSQTGFCCKSLDASTDGSDNCLPTSSTAPLPSCDNYCQNGGTCSFDGRERICKCPQEYQGPQCQTKFCEDSLCQNGGICKGTLCDCAPGYVGSNCQFSKEQMCKSAACMNGATCLVHDVKKTTCKCVEGFCGVKCDLKVEDGACRSFSTPETHTDPKGAPFPLLPIIIILILAVVLIALIVILVKRRRRRTAGFRHERIKFEDEDNIRFGNPTYGNKYLEEEDEDEMDLPFQSEQAKPAKITKSKKKKKKKDQHVGEIKTFSEEDRMEAMDEADYDERTAILS